METTADQGSSWPDASPPGPLGRADKMANKADSAIDQTARAAGDAVEKARSVTDRVSASAHAAMDKASKTAGPAMEWIEKQSTNLRKQQQRATEATANYVSENPLKAMGVCFGAGVVIGLLIRRNV